MVEREDGALREVARPVPRRQRERVHERRSPTPRLRAAPGWGKARILAIGHSTRPIAELIDLLAAAGVVTLADVRTIPRSRANPQFERTALARSLAEAGIGYAHLPALGGLRRPREDSRNAGWRNPSFRGYADHMQTPEFEEGLCQLRALARKDRSR